ncbi:glucan endo-1 3-beta-glucosidas [Striga asiatica]|uniref:glucan endo-1,3-beta-D-glucosidase n=1 Tax=Striga asiatica TaxID=4170 RepID=A0A5A7QTN1_STRAF|nr:glucan endo-1 3-beta-glucosidas [Striga asiatica]
MPSKTRLHCGFLFSHTHISHSRVSSVTSASFSLSRAEQNTTMAVVVLLGCRIVELLTFCMLPLVIFSIISVAADDLIFVVESLNTRMHIQIRFFPGCIFAENFGAGVFLLFTSICVYAFNHSLVESADGGSVGINYGRIANNLPTPHRAVQLLKSHGVDRVKIYDTDQTVLRAFSGSGIKVTINLPNELLSTAARSPSFALSWVQNNIIAYSPSTEIEAVAVGNEVSQNTTQFLLPAMYNIQNALVKYNLDSQIKVSSPIALSSLQSSYPPSAGSFRSELVNTVFKPMLDFLRKTGSTLMVNVYPFFAYESNADKISLDYALFRSNTGQVDSGNGLSYFSLFDAQVDAVFAAMSALGYDDVPITVSETGWPSRGDTNEVGATASNAAEYNRNLVRRVLTGQAGTPLRPNAKLTVFLFALFNENQKPGPTSERNFGLFYPNERRVYDIPLTLKELNGYKDGSNSNSNSNRSPPSGGGRTGGGRPRVAAGSGQTWCVARSDVGSEKLQAALDYACGEGGADCHTIQPGSTCFNPNTLEAHASYAFNSYYQKNQRTGGTCFFGGAAYVVSEQPSEHLLILFTFS